MRRKSFFTKTEIVLLIGALAFLTMMYSCHAQAGYTEFSGQYEVMPQRGIAQPPLPAGAEKSREKINVNTASAEELELLWGIGEVKAAAIVTYREENGFFTCPEDLLKVPGIGEKTLEKLRDDIVWEVTG